MWVYFFSNSSVQDGNLGYIDMVNEEIGKRKVWLRRERAQIEIMFKDVTSKKADALQ